MKKMLLVLFTSALMVLTVPVAVGHAEPIEEEPVTETIVEEYSYTNSVSSSLTISGNTAYCSGTVVGKACADRIVATLRLQKKVLWWWSDVKTWAGSVDGNYLEMHEDEPLTSSGTYRTRIDATVYSGNDSEDVYCDSIEKTYP